MENDWRHHLVFADFFTIICFKLSEIAEPPAKILEAMPK